MYSIFCNDHGTLPLDERRTQYLTFVSWLAFKFLTISNTTIMLQWFSYPYIFLIQTFYCGRFLKMSIGTLIFHWGSKLLSRIFWPIYTFTNTIWECPFHRSLSILILSTLKIYCKFCEEKMHVSLLLNFLFPWGVK